MRQAMQPQNLTELKELCEALYMGGMTPKGVDRPEKLLPMILQGMEIGLTVMQSIECITPPVNGKCSIYGDAGLALVRGSGLLKSLKESHEGEGDERKAVCEIQREGYEPRRFEYPLSLAKKLWSYKAQVIGTAKNPPSGGQWADDPDNMLMWRARWRALRTEFTDVLKGMQGYEEREDEEAIETAVVVEQPAKLPPPISKPTQAALPPAIPAERTALFERLTSVKQIMGSNLDADKLAELWKTELAAYDCKSAKELSDEKLLELVEDLEKRYTPF